MKWSFQKILTVLFVAVLAVIIFHGISTYRNNQRSIQAFYKLMQSQDVLRLADEIESEAKDIQMESTNYTMTGDSGVLAVYQIDKKDILNKYKSLKELTKRNFLQQVHIDSLGLVINQLVTFTDHFVLLKNNYDFREKDLQNKLLWGKNYRDKIRLTKDALKEHENELLVERQEASHKSIDTFNNTFIPVLAGIVFLCTIVFIFVIQNSKRRRKAEAKLHESEERLRLIMDSVEDYAIFMTDTLGNIMNWNHGAQLINGYQEEEILCRHISLLYTPEEIASGAPEYAMKIAIEKGEYESEGWRVRKDGSKFWTDTITTAIYDHKRNLKGFAKVVRDNTLRKKADDDIKEALKKEKELNELKSEFVSMASHEFRTPLNAIFSSVTLLSKYTTAEQQLNRDKHIKNIRVSVKNLISILEEFLSLGKIENGNQEPKMEEFNLKDFTNKLCIEMKSIAKPGQSIVYDHQGKDQITMDPSIVRHILSNLTSNAIKYSPDNSMINIQTRSEAGKIVFSVKDHGIGISEEDQKKLFEKFYRASNVNGVQGTGLGLHIMKSYVDKLHGTIKMNSALGKGTEVTVEIKNSVENNNASVPS